VGAEEVVWDGGERGLVLLEDLCVRVSARVVRRELSGFVRGDAEISIFRITLISDDLVTEVGAADNIFFFKNDQYFYFYQPQ